MSCTRQRVENLNDNYFKRGGGISPVADFIVTSLVFPSREQYELSVSSTWPAVDYSLCGTAILAF